MTTSAQLTAIIGEEAMQALIKWRPGGRFRVPKSPRRLAPIIGKEAAIALCSEIPWEVISVPGGRRRKIDPDTVAALAAVGHSNNEIAIILDCSTRSVHRAKTRRLGAAPALPVHRHASVLNLVNS
jgi:hypothetical protein